MKVKQANVQQDEKQSHYGKQIDQGLGVKGEHLK